MNQKERQLFLSHLTYNYYGGYMINKYKFLLYLLTILTIFLIQIVDAKTLPLKGIIITVDPGHGGIG